MTTPTLAVVSAASDAHTRPLPASIIPPLKPTPQRGRGSRRRAVEGRYKLNQNARVPANGMATAPSRNTPTTTAIVVDPMEPEARLVVSVNRRVDLLEYELSHGRLSEAAYRVGRDIQRVFERATALLGSSWSLGDRVDTTDAHEDAIIRKLEAAQAINAIRRRIVKAVGMVGFRRLRAHLAEGLTYVQAAAGRGQSGELAVTFAAKQFRALLEDIAEEWSREGARQ